MGNYQGVEAVAKEGEETLREFVNRAVVTGPGSSTDNALARWDGTNGNVVQDSTAILDDVGNLTVEGTLDALEQTFRAGAVDTVGGTNKRSMLLYSNTRDSDPDNSSSSYSGDGPVLRLGTFTADGYPSNIISEGIVVSGQNSAGGAMTHNDWGYARIKPTRVQLRNTFGGTQYDLWRVDDSAIKYRPTDDLTQDLMNLSGTNGLVINYEGLQLPTVGGTKAKLDHYEEISQNVSVFGPFVSSPTTNMRITRTGRSVTIECNDVVEVGGGLMGQIHIGTQLSTRFRPPTSRYFTIRILNNNLYNTGVVEIDQDGYLRVYQDTGLADFGTAGMNGFYSFAITYTV